jgi:membrane associated rhomboid family serine protease
LKITFNYTPTADRLATWTWVLILTVYCNVLHLHPLPAQLAVPSTVWRTVALQLQHTSWAHLGLNLAGLGILIWGFLPSCGGFLLAIGLAWGLAWVAVWVMWVEPLAWYMGLSGALHAMLGTALVLSLYTNSGRLANLALSLITVGLFVKLGLEWHAGLQFLGVARPADTSLAAPVAYEAHRGGAVGGLLLGVVVRVGCVVWGCRDKKG